MDADAEADLEADLEADSVVLSPRILLDSDGCMDAVPVGRTLVLLRVCQLQSSLMTVGAPVGEGFTDPVAEMW